jgi:hypothetical protein
VRQLSDEGCVAGSGAECASASSSGNSGNSAAHRCDAAERAAGSGRAACRDTCARAGSGDARERRRGWSRGPRHAAAST